MLRTGRHLIFSALLFAGCGDDDTKNNGDTTQQEVAPDAETVAPETTPDAETVAPETTPDTEVAQEVVEEVNTGCTPEEAGKGFVGSPCTKDCQCQSPNGAPLFCYSGFYMAGFSFCTDYADNRNPNNDLQEGDNVDTLTFPSGCFPDVPTAQRVRPIYALMCESVADCKEVSAAYTHCGTQGLEFAPNGRGTYCPDENPQAGTGTMSLVNTCLIESTPPFDGSYAE